MHFGSYSLLLFVGATNGFVLAALLWRRRANVLANRLLGLLVSLVALRLFPYILGYAGGYDLHPALTFAPFDISLAFGPLMWGYVVALTTRRMPAQWRLHAIVPALQLGYTLVCFALPLNLKWAWYSGAHLHVVEPVGLFFGLVSLGSYLFAASRQLRSYQRWLHAHFSNTEAWRLDWLHHMLAAVGVTLTLGVGYALVSWLVVPLDYFQRFPQMIAFAILAYILGALGWRYGDISYPHSAEQHVVIAPEPIDAPAADSSYVRLADEWDARIRAERWWADDALSLAVLAAHLNTSPRTVSRVLSEGRGETFHTFVNRMRVDAVASGLRDPSDERDIMVIAFDAGFNSKASFNRAFKAALGVTPSAYRSESRRKGNS